MAVFGIEGKVDSPLLTGLRICSDDGVCWFSVAPGSPQLETKELGDSVLPPGVALSFPVCRVAASGVCLIACDLCEGKCVEGLSHSIRFMYNYNSKK